MKNSPKEKILVIESHPFVRFLITEILQKNGYSGVTACETLEQAQQHLLAKNYALILVDYDVDGFADLDFLDEVLVKRPSTPVIVLSQNQCIDLAVRCLRRGAYDILPKPLNPEKLLLYIQRAFEHGFVRTEVVQIQAENPVGDAYHGLVGRSRPMKKIFELIERIRGSSVNILITGPSGAGKEMIARALHETSPRAGQKFVAINCSAIPDSLLEGELFGYKKGAFTDARTDKIGLFQEAQHGTIFLDEIGDMPLAVQPKILRALQEKEIRPLGSIQSVKIDVRIIAATNQNLTEKIASKMFREDLYYRLNAMQIELLPLKDRVEDIPLLVNYFMEEFQKKHSHKIKGISQKAMKAMIEYAWPGNVRELVNVVERASLLAQNEFILPEDLLFSTEESSVMPVTDWAKSRRPLMEIEREYILEVLNSVGGNRSETAQILGIGRKTLYNKLAKYGM